VKKASKKPVLSMTGFASVEGEVAGTRLRLEMKALNHRFLDVKLRMPREFLIIITSNGVIASMPLPFAEAGADATIP
jgi:hypothetical protein